MNFTAYVYITAQKMKFFIKDFSSKCDQIRTKLESHLLEKSITENFTFCVVYTLPAFAFVYYVRIIYSQ